MGKVTFLGVEGSGKTVLTMAIAEAFREHEKDGFFLRPDTRESFRFLEQTPSGLFHGEGEEGLPHQTTRLKYLKWTIMHQGQELRTFDTLDYPGEIYRLAFLDAKDSTDPDEFKERFAAHEAEVEELLGHLMDSELVFVLFNPSDALDLAHNPDNLDAVWVTNACLDYLRRLPQKPSFALVLTQIDRYLPAMDRDFDAQAFLREKLPLIAKTFPDLEIFTISALKGGNSIHSINRILFEAMQDTALVANSLLTVQSLTDEINRVQVRTPSDLATACSNALGMIEASSANTAGRPWFVNEGWVRQNKQIVTEDIKQEWTMILARVKEKVKSGETNHRTEENTFATISQHLSLKGNQSEEGRTLVHVITEKLRQAKQYSIECEQEKTRLRRRKFIAIGAICAVALFVIVFICLRPLIGRHYLEKGKKFANDNGVLQNDEKAAGYYLKAVSYGNVDAQRLLGVMYANGRGVRKDYNEAVKWYRKAAEQGNAAAQLKLGWMYADGRGVESNDVVAVAWFRKAAEQGDAVAQNTLGWMYDNGRGVESNGVVAVAWFREAAEQGDADAQNNLGVMYAHGRGVRKDYNEAVKWYRKAAEQGNASAQYCLGWMHENGCGVWRKDYDEAVKWYRKAAKQGDADAKKRLTELGESW